MTARVDADDAGGNPGQDRLDETATAIVELARRDQLLALPGIGPWTAEIVAMRGLGDPDAFPATDLGVRIAAEQLGLGIDAHTLDARSARWRPWRSYAVQHLWTTLNHSVKRQILLVLVLF